MKTTIETPTTTNDLRHSFTVTSNKGRDKTVIKIRLNDECRNGHEDFSITADIYKNGRDVGGGCCHEHILSLRPDLAPFVALHLSDWQGAPMHAIPNAWYWFQGAFPESADHSPNLGACHGGTGSDAKPPEKCREIFKEYIRASDEQIAEIVRQLPSTAEELQAILEDMGFPKQWKAEAARATAQMEQWTGKTFGSRATRSQFTPLSAEARALIEERRASGYYLPENVAARDVVAKAERKAKRIASLKEDHARSVEKLNRNLAAELALAAFFPGRANVIFYDHTNELSFNWSSTERLHTREEFDAFAASPQFASLPEGTKLEWRDKPKY